MALCSDPINVKLFFDTAQRDLVEAQAHRKSTLSFRPCNGRDEPMGNRDRECPCYKPCFVGTVHLCDLPLGRYSGPIRYHVQKLAICTMVVPRLYQFSGVEVKSLAGKM